jgi:ankyrin repeat protein
MDDAGIPMTGRLHRLAVVAAALCSGCDYWERPTALASAAMAGDLEEIDRLVARGDDLNEPSGRDGWPPVLYAVRNGRLPALERLFAHGAFIHGDTGRLALTLARANGDAAILAFLRASGVNA